MALAAAYNDDGFLDRRRNRLTGHRNPKPQLDYRISIERELRLSGQESSVRVTLRYIPDRLVLDPRCLDCYWDAVLSIPWEDLDALAMVILDDVNNELVPRWVSVRLATDLANGTSGYTIDMEDRQPDWDGNPA